MLQFYLSIIEDPEYIDDFEELFYKYKEKINVADQVVGNEIYNGILSIISKMPALYSEILYYHLIDELNANRIAKMFDMNLNTVKSRISRGLNLLREKIREAKLHD